MPRILHVVTHYQLGGAEKCTFELSKLLFGHVMMGVAAVLGNADSNIGMDFAKTARENGTAIFHGTRVPWKFGGFLFAAFKLRRTILDFQPNIIHLNTEVPEFTYALCVLFDPRLRKIPVVRTIHNTAIWSQWERLGAWCEKKLGDSPVIYVSKAVQSSFAKWRSNCNLSPVSRGITIYNPISVPAYRKQLINSRITQKSIRLLFAGRFEYQKGSDLLPDIIRSIKVPNDTRLSLTLYGDGIDIGSLTLLKDAPPPGWEIQLKPPISDLVEHITDFDILLFPSRFEGYGRLAAEAVLLGIPVIAFDIPVLFEIFPYDYPWLIAHKNINTSEYANKVSDLLVSLAEAQPHVDNARQLLSKTLDQGAIALSYINYYRQMQQQN